MAGATCLQAVSDTWLQAVGATWLGAAGAARVGSSHVGTYYWAVASSSISVGRCKGGECIGALIQEGAGVGVHWLHQETSLPPAGSPQKRI